VYKGILSDLGEGGQKNKNILVVRKIVSIFAFANLERQKLNRLYENQVFFVNATFCFHFVELWRRSAA
jgi:hypothetical protein